MRTVAAASFALLGALVFVTLAFPTRDHDILIADLFARKLSQTWDYWSLPRYLPDERGFNYPLAHPPAMMSLLAWLRRFTSYEWVLRVPSAYLLAGFGASMYCAAQRLQRSAGVWAMALLFSGSLYLQFLTNNSQDVYRYAAMGSAIVVLVGYAPGLAWAAVAGALLGLGAAIHSLQVVFAVIVPAAFVSAFGRKPGVLRQGAAMLAAALTVGAYPYAANLFSFGRPLIKTGSIHDIPNVNVYLREVMSTYAQVPSEWGFFTPARLQFLSPAQAGWLGVAMAAAILVVALLRPWDVERRRTWYVLAFSAAAFVLLVLDPGNLVLRIAETSFWNNLRYPQTVFPLFVVAGSAGLAAAAQRLGRPAQILSVVALIAAVYLSRDRFTPDFKLAAEDGKACVFCSDDEKRAADRSSGVFRAVRWLESRKDWRCVTFREAEYFDFTRTLSGVPYYAPAAERALSAADREAVETGLLNDGLNCVLAPAYGPMRTVLEKSHAGFSSLPRDNAVLPIAFYDVELWLLPAGPVTGSAIAASAPTEPSQSIDFALPGPGLYSFEATLATGTPVNTVGMLREPRGWERAWLGQDVESGKVRFAFVAPDSVELLHFWFSAPVSFSGVRLSRLENPRPRTGAKLPLERRPE